MSARDFGFDRMVLQHIIFKIFGFFLDEQYPNHWTGRSLGIRNHRISILLITIYKDM